MKREGVTFCDKCQFQITPSEDREGATLHYGKTDYHISCYLSYLREKGVNFGKGVLLGGQVVKETS